MVLNMTSVSTSFEGPKLRYFLLGLLFIVLLLKPTPVGLIGGLGVKLFDVVLFLYALIIYFSIGRRYFVSKNVLLVGVGLCLISILEIISFFNGARYHSYTTQDALEFSRWLMYLPFLLLGAALTEDKGSVAKIYLYSLVIFCVFSWLLFFDVMGFEKLVSPFYDLSKSRGVENLASESGLWRLAGSFNNPNYYGQFCALNAVALTWIALKNRIYSVLFFLLVVSNFCFVLLSGSRTALICMLFGVGLLVLYWIFYTRLSIFKLFFAAFFCFAFMLFLYVMYLFLMENFLRFSDVDNIILNITARFDAWSQVSLILNSVDLLLLGYGADRASLTAADNNFVAFFLKNGFLGLFVLRLGVGSKVNIQTLIW